MARVLVLTGDAAEELDSMYLIFPLREGVMRRSWPPPPRVR